MSHAAPQHLNESLRDAMLAYYLTHQAPKIEKFNIRTADDLYEYWLLDVQVSQAVPTSPVASAISSLQQYITRLHLGLEPGYEQHPMSAQHERLWTEQFHAYPVWSAAQQLRYYPANYLDPALRRNKTESFQRLENDLSHYRLQPDTVLTAVQNYLARFEAIANIHMLNGYIDGTASQLNSSIFYFVGKSTSEDAYYWRSLDASRRSADNPRQPSIHAWSDWKTINLTLPATTARQSIRPVFFNNRLYLIWAECIKPAPTSSFKGTELKGGKKDRLTDWVNSHYVKFRLNFSYKNYDDSWSPPQTCIDEYCATEDVNAATAAIVQSMTQTVAIAAPGMPATLFLGVHVPIAQGPEQQEHFRGKFFQAVEIDQHFNVTKVADGGSPERYKYAPGSQVATEINRLLEVFDTPQRGEVQAVITGQTPDKNGYYSELLPDNARKYFTFFGHTNKDNLQYKVAPSRTLTVSLTHHRSPFASNTGWNYGSKQNDVNEMTDRSPSFDPNTKKLIITSTLKAPFREPYSVTLSKISGKYEITITLKVDSLLYAPDTAQLHLSEGSMITIQDIPGTEKNYIFDFYAFYLKNTETLEEFPNFIHDTHNRLISVDRTSSSSNIDLKGKLIDKNTFIHLYTHSHMAFDIHLYRYTTYTLPQESNEHRIDEVKKLHQRDVDIIEKASVIRPNLRAYKHVIMRSNFSEYSLTDTIDANSNRILNLQDAAHASLTGSSPELPEGHSVTAHIPVPDDDAEPTITLIHGVLTLELDTAGPKVLGYAVRAFTLKVRKANEDTAPSQRLAPTVKQLSSPLSGRAEFIDFFNTRHLAYPLDPIRMNTCFAGKLVEAASLSLERLYSLTPEQWREPPLTLGGKADPIDFQGANGKYFWELFLHLPWLVTHRLNQEQQYADALAWLKYIFDPSRAADTFTGRPAYWGFGALTRDRDTVDDWTIDPHQQAMDATVHFRKAIYLLYLDILINCGDAAYRQQRPDSLTQAKLWYIRVNQLLQTRPTITTVEPWDTITLGKLTENASQALKQLEQQAPPIDFDRPVNSHNLLWLTHSDHLCLPFNPDLVARWDKLESRLHNLRHNLDISGKPLRLALYATPLLPRQLLASPNKSTPSLIEGPQLTPAPTRHYRFRVMLGHALSAAETLIQFGATILSLTERKEQAEYLELQQQQAWDLADIVVAQQNQALLIDEKNRQALDASREISEAREAYYDQQLTEGISRAETEAGQLYLTSASFEAAGALAGAAAGMAMLAPNIVGMSVGGSRWEGPFHAAQSLAQGAASDRRSTAADLDRTEQFNRRAREWTLAREQARLEIVQIDLQRQAYAEQEKATRLQLRLSQTSLAHARSSYQLLAKRFSNAQLYDWVNAHLSRFFYQAYDLCRSLCLSAEACWQYEIADFTRRFIHTDAWNNSYHGYLAGEALKLSLLNMNAAYLDNHVQDLEIVKTLSLRHRVSDLDTGVQAPLTADKTVDTQALWQLLKRQLVDTGVLHFKLTKALFEQDYPGHRLRRIKRISVSLPATLGPYEDIRAILIQTSNRLELPDLSTHTDLRAHQQIALSTGLDDNGQFALTFDSQERYLPFEYTGAISSWTLKFAEPARQKAMLESINDIVIHLHYTARGAVR